MAKELRLDGIQAAFAMLDGLPAKMQANTLRSVHRNIVNKTLKPYKPTLHGVDEFIKTTTDRQDPTAIQFGVESKAFWFRFLEYGTVSRKTKKGAGRGTMKPEPFWRRFTDGQVANVVRKGNDEYTSLIGKFIKSKLRRLR